MYCMYITRPPMWQIARIDLGKPPNSVENYRCIWMTLSTVQANWQQWRHKRLPAGPRTHAISKFTNQRGLELNHKKLSGHQIPPSLNTLVSPIQIFSWSKHITNTIKSSKQLLGRVHRIIMTLSTWDRRFTMQEDHSILQNPWAAIAAQTDRQADTS